MPRTLKDTTGAELSVESLRDKTLISDLSGKDIVLGGVDTGGNVVAVSPSAIAKPPKATKVTPQNGWVNFGAPYPDLAYAYDANQLIITGGIKNGPIGASVLFTLPPEARPMFGGNYPIVNQGATANDVGAGYIYVGPDGTVAANVRFNTTVVINAVIPRTPAFF